MKIIDFIEAYSEELHSPEYQENDPFFLFKDHCDQVAHKMTHNVIKDASRHDWLKYNNAMRRAAARFGIRSSKIFREVIKKAI